MSINMIGEKLVLMRSDQYEMWISIKRKTAVAAGIWDTCNPDTEEHKLRVIAEPVIPTAETIKQGAVYELMIEGQARVVRKAKVSDLDADEKDELVWQRQLHTQKQRKYESEYKASASLVIDIVSTIDPEFLLQLTRSDTPYELLGACKRKYKQTAREAEKAVLDKWSKLYSAPNVANVEAWIMKWENVFEEGRALGIPEMEEWRAVGKLLDVIHIHVASEFAVPLKAQISNPRFSITFRDLCSQFLTWWKQNLDMPKPRGRHGAFGVGQGGTDDGAKPTLYGKDSEGRFTHCICGATEHKLVSCPYVMQDVRPANWTGVPETQVKVDKLVRESYRLAMAIERKKKQRSESNRRKAGMPKGS